MADFVIKQGDELPVIECILKDRTKTAVNLTGSSVYFHLAKASNHEVVLNDPAIIVSAIAGRVSYSFEGDLAPGDYIAEWEVIFNDGKPEKFPNGSNLAVQVFRRVAESNV